MVVYLNPSTRIRHFYLLPNPRVSSPDHLQEWRRCAVSSIFRIGGRKFSTTSPYRSLRGLLVSANRGDSPKSDETETEGSRPGTSAARASFFSWKYMSLGFTKFRGKLWSQLPEEISMIGFEAGADRVSSIRRSESPDQVSGPNRQPFFGTAPL